MKSPAPVAYLQLRHRMPTALPAFPSRALTTFENRALQLLGMGVEIQRSELTASGTVNVIGAKHAGDS